MEDGSEDGKGQGGGGRREAGKGGGGRGKRDGRRGRQGIASIGVALVDGVISLCCCYKLYSFKLPSPFFLFRSHSHSHSYSHHSSLNLLSHLHLHFIISLTAIKRNLYIPLNYNPQ